MSVFVAIAKDVCDKLIRDYHVNNKKNIVEGWPGIHWLRSIFTPTPDTRIPTWQQYIEDAYLSNLNMIHNKAATEDLDHIIRHKRFIFTFMLATEREYELINIPFVNQLQDQVVQMRHQIEELKTVDQTSKQVQLCVKQTQRQIQQTERTIEIQQGIHAQLRAMFYLMHAIDTNPQ